MWTTQFNVLLNPMPSPSDVGDDAAQRVVTVMTRHGKNQDLDQDSTTISLQKQVRSEINLLILIVVSTMTNARSDAEHENDVPEAAIVTKTVPSLKGRACRLGMKPSIL